MGEDRQQDDERRHHESDEAREQKKRRAEARGAPALQPVGDRIEQITQRRPRNEGREDRTEQVKRRGQSKEKSGPRA